MSRPNSQIPNRPALRTMALRLGGRDGIRRIVGDFYHRMQPDILIGFFFEGKDLEQIADRQTDFLCFVMGLTETYSGKSPTAAHVGLAPILSGHFDRRLKILDQTLEAHGLTPQERSLWIGLEESFRSVVVTS